MNGVAGIIVQFLYKNEIRLNEGENKGKMWLKRENIRKWCKKLTTRRYTFRNGMKYRKKIE